MAWLREQVPRKQGLKLDPSSSRSDRSFLREQVPRKQGLKYSENTLPDDQLKRSILSGTAEGQPNQGPVEGQQAEGRSHVLLEIILLRPLL
jgi:hypothetical protein